MVHHILPFFWADMSIYPGNSGGPVVEDGKLVGVVSAQAVEFLIGAGQGSATAQGVGKLRSLSTDTRCLSRRFVGCP
jgi:CBS domain-containing protein